MSYHPKRVYMAKETTHGTYCDDERPIAISNEHILVKNIVRSQ